MSQNSEREIEFFLLKSINSISHCKFFVYFCSITHLFSRISYFKRYWKRTHGRYITYNSFHNRLVTITDWWLSCVPHYVTLSISAACLLLRKRLCITVGNHIDDYSIEFRQITLYIFTSWVCLPVRLRK